MQDRLGLPPPPATSRLPASAALVSCRPARASFAPAPRPGRLSQAPGRKPPIPTTLSLCSASQAPWNLPPAPTSAAPSPREPNTPRAPARLCPPRDIPLAHHPQCVACCHCPVIPGRHPCRSSQMHSLTYPPGTASPAPAQQSKLALPCYPKIDLGAKSLVLRPARTAQVGEWTWLRLPWSAAPRPALLARDGYPRVRESPDASG